MNARPWDVVVVGAGAAGLFAATAACRSGARTLLIEKNRKIGVKILMSGGTRCNLTQATDWRGIATAFGGQQSRFLKYALASFTPAQTVAWFESAGVPTRTESTGKIFPASNRAVEVRDALVDAARAAGVQIRSGVSVSGIRPPEPNFILETSDGHVTGYQLIITTGGQSYPECGTSGDGYAWMIRLGHRIMPPRPALTPIRVNQAWVRELAGVTVADAVVAVRLQGQSSKTAGPRSSDRGSFLFTHRGCSGPAVLNVSRTVTDPLHNVSKTLVCDWLPATREQDLRDQLTCENGGARSLGSVLLPSLPRRLVETLAAHAGAELNCPLAQLGRKRTSALVQGFKACQLAIDGTLGFAKAEVTAGGVALDEVDPLSMSSRIVPGLFLAGEILDIDGPIGGYNFQAAWSTGRLAGISAAAAALAIARAAR